MRHPVYTLLALVALSLVALACGGGGDSDNGGPDFDLFGEGAGGVYLALGDSVAAGSGASDAATTSYVALVADALRGRFGETLELRSFAVAGHTTQAFIDEQLQAALDVLAGNEVRLVTLTISGNDLALYAAHEACLREPSDPECPLEDGLLEVEQRLSRILRELRAAGPGLPIAIQVYPNLFSGTGHPFEYQADVSFELLNGVIASVARRHGVLVADPRAAFVGEGSRLTHLEDPTPDAHPNDAGHALIAAAFLDVLGLSGE